MNQNQSLDIRIQAGLATFLYIVFLFVATFFGYWVKRDTMGACFLAGVAIVFFTFATLLLNNVIRQTKPNDQEP
jgi:Zn-dependent protease with chaperone function